MTGLTLFTATFWKATVILAAPFAAVVWRRTSASTRHFLWSAAFAALLLLPVAALVLPEWAPAQPTILAQSLVLTAASPVRVPTPSKPFPTLPLVWLAGCLVTAARFLAGAARAARLVRGASPAPYAQQRLHEMARGLGIRRPVRALETAQAPVPLTWGILRPVAVLPTDAPQWPEARRDAVLLHELIHIRRHDLLAQALAHAACCLYWFHPLAWAALRELRKERERACDDAVVLSGHAPHDYAAHLMDMVRWQRAQASRWAGALAMAEPSDFESRIRALLDRGKNRRPLSRRAAVAIASAALAALLPFAAITARAQASRAALAGTVEDPSGARIAKCRVTAKSLDGPNQETTTSNQAGEFQFASIPPGRYSLEVSAPGFVLYRGEVTLAAGVAARVDAHLSVGGIAESVVVRGQKPPTTTITPAGPRIRVSGGVTQARLVRQPKPVYPTELQQLGVEGTVVMAAIISKSGTVLNPVVRNTVDSRLAQAALDAVRQWTYEPATLNGEPIEVLTTITLDFQLGQ